MALDKHGNPDIARVTYLPISDEQRAYVEDLKLRANSLMTQYRGQFTNDPNEQRLWELARTHLEIASMFAVKAATCTEPPGHTPG